jgi:predicted HD phosphohydrolase
MDETEPSALQAEIDTLLAEHRGDARAVIAALLHDLSVLASDAESRTSRGYVRGRFAQPQPRRRISGTSGG